MSFTSSSSALDASTSPPLTTGKDIFFGSFGRSWRRIDAISNFAIETFALGFISITILPEPNWLTDETFSTPFTTLTAASMREVMFCSTTLAEAFCHQYVMVSVFPCSGRGSLLMSRRGISATPMTIRMHMTRSMLKLCFIIYDTVCNTPKERRTDSPSCRLSYLR